jgi:hypothetical protein
MPRITGRNTSDDDESVAASLKSMGDSMFKPVDPVAAEKIRQMRMQSAARTNMVAALQRGDLIEYGAQGIQAGVPIADAQGYAMQAGAIGPDGRARSDYGPRFSPAPQPPAPGDPMIGPDGNPNRLRRGIVAPAVQQSQQRDGRSWQNDGGAIVTGREKQWRPSHRSSQRRARPSRVRAGNHKLAWS